MITHCTDTTFPARGGVDHYLEKARLGVQDVAPENSSRMLPRLTGNPSGCWTAPELLPLIPVASSAMRTFSARGFPRKERMLTCITNVLDARLYCINCHLNVGHFSDQKPPETEISS